MSIQRLSLAVVLAALCVVAPRMTALAQSVASQSPAATFRSTVDLLTLDASVRDKAGLPIPDLQASDFTVTIDGKPRRVVSAVFFKSDESAGRGISGGAAPTPRHVTNEGTQPGRVLVLALDALSIQQGKEKALFDTASRMLDGLSPADAVGLIEFQGPSIEVTRDRSVIAKALQGFRGRFPREAEVIAGGKNNPLTNRAHAQAVLLDLANLLRRMSAVRAPRSVILISGGLPFDTELITQYTELQRAAAESRVTLYTVLVEQVGYDTSRGETRPDLANDPALADGLATIASRTGGMFFYGLAKATGVFERLQSEVTSFYQLGLESSPADADGKQHDVKVKVNRTGLDVRAGTHISVAKPLPKPAPRDPLAVALQQPTDVADVPLAITAYSTHPSQGTVRLLISAEVGARDGARPAEWGFAVNQKGKNVVTRRGRIPAGSERPRVISTTVEVPPGEYRLRVAAVDADDRIGVLEIPITAGYETAAAAVVSDLIVGVAAGGQLEPRRRIERSDEITAMLEILPGSGAVPGGTLQLIPGGSARSVLSAPMTVRPAPSAGEPAILEARAALASVPPGRYTASVALVLDGQPLTRISRVIEITGPPPVAIVPDVAAPPAVEATASADSPDDLMRRVGGYIEQYGGQASLLVGVEHYAQSATHTMVIPDSRGADGRLRGSQDVVVIERRRLVSEFALVANRSTSGGWLGYRDVIEMDGKPVSDRRDRLQGLFRADAPDVEEARRIVDAGARYNIGPVSRNFNVPTTTLFFFHTGNLPRFTFRRKGGERIDNIDTVEIDFREERIPTLVMNSARQDVPSSGTLWVNPADGAVVRTRLELEKFDNAGSRAVIDVRYRKDPVLAMWVPTRMTESYSAASPSGKAKDTAKTEATYKDFKRFETSVKIK